MLRLEPERPALEPLHSCHQMVRLVVRVAKDRVRRRNPENGNGRPRQGQYGECGVAARGREAEPQDAPGCPLIRVRTKVRVRRGLPRRSQSSSTTRYAT